MLQGKAAAVSFESEIGVNAITPNGADALAEEHHLSFIQTEMFARSIPQKDAKLVPSVAGEPADESSSLAAELSCDINLFEANGAVEIDSVGELALRDEYGGKVIEESVRTQEAESTQEACTVVVRYVLQLLILALIADGLTRWRTAKNVARRRSSQKTSVAEQSQKCPALVSAVLKADYKKIETLLEKNATCVNTADVWGCTALHVAALQSCPNGKRLASLLLQQGARVDARDCCEETPLHAAARKGTTDVCEVLLAFGAEIDSPNIQEKTPLVVAAQEGRQDMCTFLMGHGASVGILPQEDFAALPMFLHEMLKESPAASASFASEQSDGSDGMQRDSTQSENQSMGDWL
eukprot:TRINITY_DN68535_c0_g1_i1.p1 TRINITY_DN68535_c0_g1~~TRINITY_DN68535_c0_g1_i1.p1  ORF type:complete len:397 (+),score=79.23 TRINITY_DN68535_c0_g1_i1:136-1191(+)